MKAVYLKENGGIEKLLYTEDFPVPEIKDNDILIKVEALSLNRVDTLIREGYPGLNLSFPHIPGGDAAGFIEKTGKDVKNFKIGDRIVVYPIIVSGDDEFIRAGKENLSPSWKFIGMHRQGAYAEYLSVPETSVLKLPDNVSFEQAAALPVAGMTAFHALLGTANLKEGSTFFIWGGASGVGTIAVQLALWKKCKVFATAGSDDKIEFLKKLGVHYVFNHYEDKNISDKVVEITGGRGVDVVLDYVGPLTYQQSFNMLKRGGKLLWCGIISGRETTVSIHQTYFRHLTYHGIFLGEKKELESLVRLVSEGMVNPVIYKSLTLAEARKAHTIIESGEVIGKIILKP